MLVYGKECPRSLQFVKIVLKYISLQLKENITLGGKRKFSTSNNSSTKSVPHWSMTVYEYHHKTLEVITEWMNFYTLQFTACNSCCFTGNVSPEIQQVHCHSGHHNLLQKFIFLLLRTSLPHTPPCFQYHSHVHCGCTQSIRQSIHYSLQATSLIIDSMNSKQSAKNMFQSFDLWHQT